MAIVCMQGRICLHQWFTCYCKMWVNMNANPMGILWLCFFCEGNSQHSATHYPREHQSQLEPIATYPGVEIFYWGAAGTAIAFAVSVYNTVKNELREEIAVLEEECKRLQGTCKKQEVELSIIEGSSARSHLKRLSPYVSLQELHRAATRMVAEEVEEKHAKALAERAKKRRSEQSSK